VKVRYSEPRTAADDPKAAGRRREKQTLLAQLGKGKSVVGLSNFGGAFSLKRKPDAELAGPKLD
jgi:hypothetical protein